MTKDVDKYVDARIELEDLAAQSLTYKLDDSCDPRLLDKEDKVWLRMGIYAAVGIGNSHFMDMADDTGLQYFLGNAYKAKVLEAMSADQLVDIILTNPTVHISPSYRDTVCWIWSGSGNGFCQC